MKVKSLRLKHFKKFREEAIDFSDPETGLAKDLIVIVGNNGSGKSTILQAIACLLGTATKRLKSPSDLQWPGFDLSLVSGAWRTPYELWADIEFTHTECEATLEYFLSIPDLYGRTPPGTEKIVTLTMKDGQVKADTEGGYFQFRGYEYAKQVVKLVPEGYGVFHKVGKVLWYSENREATSLTPIEENGNKIIFNEEILRRRLSDLMLFHERVDRGEYQLKPGQHDLFADLSRMFQTVFPERRFDGPVPRADIDEVMKEPHFYLYDGKNQYEISEMSGGERAIFPMIFDFANWSIHNSIILIDEIELHLHPPMQQHLIRMLKNLGENNQFIITTHSDWVEQVLPESAILRLPA